MLSACDDLITTSICDCQYMTYVTEQRRSIFFRLQSLCRSLLNGDVQKTGMFILLVFPLSLSDQESPYTELVDIFVRTNNPTIISQDLSMQLERSRGMMCIKHEI